MRSSVRVEFRPAQRALLRELAAIQRGANTGIRQGATLVANRERREVPRASRALSRTIVTRRIGPAAYDVAPTARYAGYVLSGTKPGYTPPIEPLMAWLRTRRASKGDAGRTLRDRAFGLARAIRARGTKANDFVGRTARGATPLVHALAERAIASAQAKVR